MEGAAVTRRWRAWRFAARQFCTLRAALDAAGAGGMVEARVGLSDIAENILEVPFSTHLDSKTAQSGPSDTKSHSEAQSC